MLAGLTLCCLVGVSALSAQIIGPITFDDGTVAPGVPIDGLQIQPLDAGAEHLLGFRFTVLGESSVDAAIRRGPNNSAFVGGFGLEGPTEGTLSLDFDRDIFAFSAGVSLRVELAEGDAVVVTATDANGAMVRSESFATRVVTDGTFAGNWVAVESTEPFRSLSIRFATKARRFLVDNLVLTTQPRPELGISLGEGSTTPKVAQLSDGRLVIAWSRDGNLVAQVMNGAGEPVSTPIPIASLLNFNEAHSVTALADGGFAVAWYGSTSRSAPQPADGLYLRKFTGTGFIAGNTRLVLQKRLGLEVQTSMAALASGVALAWSDGSAHGIHLVGPSTVKTLATGGINPDSRTQCGLRLASVRSALIAAWCQAIPGSLETGIDSGVFAKSFGEDGTPKGSSFALSNELFGRVLELHLESRPVPGGGESAVAVWRQQRSSISSVLYGRVLSNTKALSPVLRVQPTANAVTSLPALTVRTDGAFATGWQESFAQDGTTYSQVVYRLHEASGIPASEAIPLLVSSAARPSAMSIAWRSQGLSVAFQNGSGAGLDASYYLQRETTLDPDLCSSSPRALCLGDGRFRASILWRDFYGQTGEGTAAALSRDTGYFWFFQNGAADLIIKILDGSENNDHQWVYYGSLTNVQFDLLVEDRLTGTTKTYRNPLHKFASNGDTRAFPEPALPSQDVGSDIQVSGNALHFDAAVDGFPFWSNTTELQANSEESECARQALNLPGSFCLADRFLVSATWRDFQSTAGAGVGTRLLKDTGTFWFFSPENVELVVKILDGRSVNGHFWVFYGALSNVEYTLQVTDTLSGQSTSYTNPSGTFASGGDTTALGG